MAAAEAEEEVAEVDAAAADAVNDDEEEEEVEADNTVGRGDAMLAGLNRTTYVVASSAHVAPADGWLFSFGPLKLEI